MPRPDSSSHLQHVIILGGGFGGRYAALGLAARLPREHRITVIDRVDRMLYTPMLSEVAGGTVRAADIAVRLSRLPRRVTFIKGEITAVDSRSRVVTLSDGRSLQATQLVFALGSTTNYHHIPGARENSVALKTLADAQEVLARVDGLVAKAAGSTDAKERREWLTVAVAGGGYTGVETMAAVSSYIRERARAAGLSPDEIKLVLVEPTDRLMNESPASLAAYGKAQLERNGIRVDLNVSVTGVEGDTLRLSNGDSHVTGLLLWDAGITPSPLLKDIDVPKGKHHGVTVNGCFQVQGVDSVWAIGDCAEIPQAGGKTYASTAQNATREGTHLAQNINAVVRGRAPRPFRFKMLGQLALIGKRNAVAEIFGMKFRGLLAWALWWVVYIVKLPYRKGRIGVLKSLAASARAG